MNATDLLAPSIKDALLRRIERQPDSDAVHFRPSGEAPFHRLTWRQLWDEVDAAGRAMVSLGLEPGDRVATWSDNRVEWIICDLAMHCLGLVHVPIHRPLSAQQAAAQILHSGAAIVWVEDAGQAHALRTQQQLSANIPIVVFEDDGRIGSTANVLSGGALLARFNPADQEAWSERLREPNNADQLASILYTSGTTGEPKGVMLSHENLLFTASQMERRFGSFPTQRRMVLLPLSHIFARTCDLYVWLLGQGELALAQSRETACDDCVAIAPHVLNAVPYFFQKIQRRMEQGAEIESLLGSELRFGCVGGAPLAPETYDFFAEQGLPLLQGYGLTETSPVISACCPGHDRRGSVGLPLEGAEVRIQAGEIQVRGPHVMRGYYKDPRGTAETLDDGWLKTGDLGRVDADGYLFVTGRSKEMIVLSTGKNVAPAQIESLLVADAWFEQVLVLGDNRSCLAALVVLSDEGRQATAGREEELVQERMDQRLQSLGRHEQVRRCAIMPRAFSLEAGELTAKLSLRRDQIERNWRDLIEGLYAK